MLDKTATVRCWLHGSPGPGWWQGHGSDTAVLLGLAGHEPDTVEVDHIAAYLADVRTHKRLTLPGGHAITFAEKDDLFMRAPPCPSTPTACAWQPGCGGCHAVANAPTTRWAVALSSPTKWRPTARARR